MFESLLPGNPGDSFVALGPILYYDFIDGISNAI